MLAHTTKKKRRSRKKNCSRSHHSGQQAREPSGAHLPAPRHGDHCKFISERWRMGLVGAKGSVGETVQSGKNYWRTPGSTIPVGPPFEPGSPLRPVVHLNSRSKDALAMMLPICSQGAFVRVRLCFMCQGSTSSSHNHDRQHIRGKKKVEQSFGRWFCV